MVEESSVRDLPGAIFYVLEQDTLSCLTQKERYMSKNLLTEM